MYGDIKKSQYRKHTSSNDYVKAQNKRKPTSVVEYCRFYGSNWRILLIWLFTKIFVTDILVPRASVSFGHVVGETEGSSSSKSRFA